MIPLDYGRRTGVTSFIRILTALCTLLSEFRPLIENWINASSLTMTQKGQLLALIASMVDICALIPTLKAIDD